jgi:hypothetical protein
MPEIIRLDTPEGEFIAQFNADTITAITVHEPSIAFPEGPRRIAVARGKEAPLNLDFTPEALDKLIAAHERAQAGALTPIDTVEAGLWCRVYADSVQTARGLSVTEREAAEALATQAADRAVANLRARTNPAK